MMYQTISKKHWRNDEKGNAPHTRNIIKTLIANATHSLPYAACPTQKETSKPQSTETETCTMAPACITPEAHKDHNNRRPSH
jgi:hypothetical protein